MHSLKQPDTAKYRSYIPFFTVFTILVVLIIGVGMIAGVAAGTPPPTDGGEEIWTTALGEDEDGTEATVVDGVVYVGTKGGEIIALDADTGNELWNETVIGDIEYAPSVIDGVVYVGANDGNTVGNYDSHLYAYEADTGSLKWSESIGSHHIRSSPVVYEERVYIGMTDGILRAHSAGDGSQDWTEEVSFEWPRGASPVAADGTLFVPIRSGDLVALDVGTGAELWKRTLDNRVTTTPTYVDGTVYVTSTAFESSGCTGCFPRELPTDTHTVHALDAGDGSEEWTYSDGIETRASANSPTVVSDDVVYFASGRQTAYELDADGGEVLETYEIDEGQFAGTPTVAGDSLFLATYRWFDGAAGVYAFDRQTGGQEWFFGDESAHAAPIVADGSVFVPTRLAAGELATYRAIDAGVSASSRDSQAVQGTNGHTDAWTGGAPSDPIELVDASMQESGTLAGTGWSVDVTYRNVGNQEETHISKLEIEDYSQELIFEEELTIPAYGETEYTFTKTPIDPGSYPVTVDGDEIGTLTIVSEEQPVYVSDAALTDEYVLEGSEFTVEATFENLADSQASHTATLTVDGTEKDTQTRTVDGESTETVTFTAQMVDAGLYDVDVDGREASAVDVRGDPTFVTDGTLTQNRILVNEGVPFDVTVRNVGDDPQMHTTSAQFVPVDGPPISGATIGTREIPAHDELEDSRSVIIDEEGVYDVFLDEETADGDVELFDLGTVQTFATPVQVQGARLVNESVEPGEPVELEFVYENVKGDPVSQAVTVDRAGEQEVTETVELGAYETETVRIELDGFGEWGTYDLTISDEQTDIDGHTETVYVGKSDFFVPVTGSIQEAVDAASPGDVIAVAGGTYNEAVIIETANLELIGFDDETPVLNGEDGTNETAFEFGATGSTVDGFEIREYGTSGIDVGWADDATIANTTLQNNGGSGVAGGSPGNDPDGLTIEHSVIEGHADDAIDVGLPNGVTIRNTTLKNNGDGIRVRNDAIVTNNTIIDQDGSTAISTRNNALVANNTISNVSWSGIRVNSGSTVEQNVLHVEETGIDLRGDNIDVLDNEVTSGLDDLRVSGSVGHTILNNTFETGLFLIDADEQSAASLTVEDNKVGGDPLYFAVDETAPSVPNDAGQVILIDVTDATVEGHAFSGVISAVQVVNGSDVHIENVQLTDGPSSNVLGDQGTDRAAVSIWDSPRTVVQDSTFASMGDHAVRLSNSPNSTVTDNELTATGRTAISIHSSADVEIRDNNVFDAQSGVWIDRSDRTAINANHLETLNGSAIEFERSENVSIANNTVNDTNRIVSGIFDDFAIGGGDTGFGGADTITGATVTENTVSNGSGYGILLKGSEQIEISDNNASQNERGIGVEWVQSLDGDGVTISNNQVLANDEVGIRLDAGTNGLDNITVTDNVIQETQERGLLVESQAIDVTVTNNLFLANTDGVRYERQSGQLNVTDNWWGDATGPSGGLQDPETNAVADGDGDSIAEYLGEDNVRFDPWIDAESPQTGTLSGTVTNSSAVAGATVAIEYDTGFEQTTETNDTGHYELVTLEGSYNVSVEADGYSSTEESNVTITGQETTVQDVTMTPESPGLLTGTITDSDTGDPVEDVAIALIDSRVIDGDNTDQDGTYEVDSVDPGVYEVNFAIDGYEDKRLDNIVIADDETTTLDVELNAVGLGTIAGTVTDEDTGTSVEGVLVQIYDADDRLVTDGETDAQGEYEFEMEPGTYRVIIRGGAIGYEQSDTDGIGVSADGTTTLDVELTPEGSEDTGTVSGTVTENDGTPIVGATVEILQAGSTAVRATNTTIETGEYRFDVEAGTYDVEVSASGYEQTVIQDVEITEGETTTRDIELIPESDIIITSADVSSTAIEVGTSVTITTDIENRGGASNDFTAYLVINSTIEDDETIGVDPSETETITFEHVFDEPGDFDVTVNGFAAGSVSVSEESVDSPTVAVDDVQATETIGTTVYTNDEVETTLSVTNDSAISDVRVRLDSMNTTYAIEAGASHDAGEEWVATVDVEDIPDDGHYQVSATVTDDAGLTNDTVADETILVDREQPSLSAAITDVDGDNGTIEIRSDTELANNPDIIVTKPDSSNETLSDLNNVAQTWTADLDFDGSGEYTVETNGTDHAGNEGSASTAVRVDTDFTISDGVGTLHNEDTGTFIEFNSSEDSLEALFAVLSENTDAYEELDADQIGAGFLTATLDETLDENLTSATIHVPANVSTIDGIDDPADVTLQRYNESTSTWESVNTTVETIAEADTELDVTGTYWVAEVDGFSTYGAIASDDEPPTITDVTPTDGETLSDGTSDVDVSVEYEDDASGVDVSTVELVINGQDVTGDAGTSITSSETTHTVDVDDGESYTIEFTIADTAGNQETYTHTFTVDDSESETSPSSPSSSPSSSSSSSSSSSTPEEPADDETESEDEESAPGDETDSDSTDDETVDGAGDDDDVPTTTDDETTDEAIDDEDVPATTDDDTPGFGAAITLIAFLTMAGYLTRRQ